MFKKILFSAALFVLTWSTAHAEPPPLAGASVTPIEVRNPLGVTMRGHTVVDPAKDTPEFTILAALKSQKNRAAFPRFLSFMHSSAKSEVHQRDRLRAYQYKSSRGGTADRCIHDGALVVAVRRDVNAQVAGSGSQGVKVFVWCGEQRMPVPFTMYPEGSGWKIKVWGLN